MEGGKLRPLVAEWSPKRVRLYNPATRKVTTGISVAEALEGDPRGRDIVVAVSQKSAFIRSLFVPDVSRSEAAKILELKLGELLPIPQSECAFGFRLGPEIKGRGRLAVVGAVKTESLRRIAAETRELGLKIRAIVPVAFGSWLAAREKSLRECIVVEADGDAVHMDVIHEGEICYSRSIPMPDSADELQDEVERTFTIAGVPPSPVFSTGCPGVHAEWTHSKEAIEYLADPQLIKRLLFTLELPEAAEGRAARAERWRAVRALAAAAGALVLGGYAYTSRLANTPKPLANVAKARSLLKETVAKTAQTQKRLRAAEKANRILDVAFSPGQSISDVVTVLSQSASKDSWFTNIVLTRGAPISISGLAMTDDDVAKFSAGISKNPRFSEMKVVSLNRGSVGKRPVTQFLMLGKVSGLLAFDRPPKTEKLTKGRKVT